MATLITPLTGLRDMQGNIIPSDKSPNINVNVFFSTSPDARNNTPVPTTCDQIVNRAKALTQQNFLQLFKLVDASKDPSQRSNDMKTNLTFFRDGLLGGSIDQLQQIQSPNLITIQRYLDTIETSQLPVLRQVNQCLTETSQPDTSEYIEQQQSTSESKARLDAIQNADTNVSYYEGWFPLFRPMKEASLFGLFAASLLLLLLSTTIFLRFAGIQIDIIFPFTESNGGEGTSYTPYILMGIGLSATIGLLQWYFTKN